LENDKNQAAWQLPNVLMLVPREQIVPH